MGLVSHVYPAEELMDKAMELAQAIAANAQVAVRQSKAAIRHGLQTDMYTGAALRPRPLACASPPRSEGRHDRLCQQGQCYQHLKTADRSQSGAAAGAYAPAAALSWA